jgi:glycerol-3-phosphate acyltransferase PlsY
MIKGIASVAVAYLMGSIPFGYIIYRIKRGGDIREVGSGNIGATNVARFLGVKGWIFTFGLDLTKGLFAVLIARFLSPEPIWIASSGVAAIIGHSFPLFIGFRGGKGVATSLGVFIALAPIAVLPSLGLFVLLVSLFRYISLGSMSAAVSFPLFVLLFNYPREIVIGSFICAALIIIRHKDNLKRLLTRSESRVLN